MLLVDSSVWLAALDPRDEGHAACVGLIRRAMPECAALELTRLEVVNVAVRKWRSRQQAELALALIEQCCGTIVGVDAAFARSVCETADTLELSAYDASYIVAARALGATLVSLDVRDLVEPGHARHPADVEFAR